MAIDPKQSMSAYFAGVLDEAGIAELDCWLAASRENADRFALFAIEQRALENLLRSDRFNNLAETSWAEFENDASPLTNDQAPARLLADLAAMEASAQAGTISISERIAEQEARAQALAQARKRKHVEATPQGPRVIVIPRPLFWSGIAAVLLLGSWLTLQAFSGRTAPAPSTPTAEVEPKPPAPPAKVAFFEAGDDARWAVRQGQPAPPNPGQPLIQGEYQLLEGTAKLRFNDGAMVLIESPARFSLDTAHAMTLHDGRAVGYCDEHARGFIVRTPHAEFVDLGTEFGVTVRPGKDSQLHVFAGEVRATSLSQSGQVGEPFIVTERQAVSASHDTAVTLLPTGADAQRFLATRRVSITAWNTGQAWTNEDTDAHWQVTAINGQPLAQPFAATRFVVPDADPDRPDLAFRGSIDRQLGWITVDPQFLQAGDRTLTFRTEFDLGRLDPETAELELAFLADNFVAEIRLNGKPITVPDHPRRPPYLDLSQTTITTNFVPGLNRLEIVIENVPSALGGGDYLALIAELSLTSQLPWRSPEDRNSPAMSTPAE